MKHKRLTLLLATLLLTGCTGTAQVQNRAFVQLLGADADRNANRVTAVSFGMEEPASGTGETLLTALEAAQCRYDRALMLGHTQVLVCGKGGLEQRLSLLLDGNRISPGCRLVCADDAARVLEETGAGLETALSRMAEGGALYAPAVSDTLSDLLGASGMAVVPYVSGSDLGMCVVDRAGNIRTTLSEEACRGVRAGAAAQGGAAGGDGAVPGGGAGNRVRLWGGSSGSGTGGTASGSGVFCRPSGRMECCHCAGWLPVRGACGVACPPCWIFVTVCFFVFSYALRAASA